MKIKNVRRKFYAQFSTEIKYIRDFVNAYPIISLGIAFFCGLIVDGILRARVSHFVILSLVGGFALALPYGTSFGLPPFLSILLVVPIHTLTAYIVLRIIYAIESSPRAKPYLAKLRNRYRQSSQFLFTRVGKLGIGGVLTLCSFFFGWLPTIVIGYFLDVDISTTMKAVVLGGLMGAGVFWAIYEGLVIALPINTRWIQILIISVSIVIFIFNFVRRKSR
jgi:hypothetical protein